MISTFFRLILATLIAQGSLLIADEYVAEADLRPRRAFAADGSFVEVTNDREHIRAARFDAEGKPFGKTIVVDAGKTAIRSRPELKNHSIAMNPGGGFLVAWGSGRRSPPDPLPALRQGRESGCRTQLREPIAACR